MSDLSDMLEEAYGAPQRDPPMDGPTTADVLAQYRAPPEPSWHDKYVKPFGSAAIAQQEPNWFGRNVLGTAGKVSEQLPPGVGDAILAGLMGPRARIPNPIKAYHGSPHDFDAFDLSKIGTGEGAQAYGHGLYFAEHEPVARSYRDMNAPVRSKIPDDVISLPPEIRQAITLQAGTDKDAMTAARWAQNMAPAIRGDDPAKWADMITRLRDAKQGKMYEVAIHATPEQFLDWDKPLAGQSPAIRQALDPALETVRRSNADIGYPTKPDMSVSEFFRTHKTQHENADLAAAGLREAGIPGIKYLDQGSRGFVPPTRNSPQIDAISAKMDAMATAVENRPGSTSEDLRRLWSSPEFKALEAEKAQAQQPQRTSNYVVWSPEIIEILKKYGLAGAAPAAGATLSQLLSQPSPTSQ